MKNGLISLFLGIISFFNFWFKIFWNLFYSIGFFKNFNFILRFEIVFFFVLIGMYLNDYFFLKVVFKGVIF